MQHWDGHMVFGNGERISKCNDTGRTEEREGVKDVKWIIYSIMSHRLEGLRWRVTGKRWLAYGLSGRNITDLFFAEKAGKKICRFSGRQKDGWIFILAERRLISCLRW